MEQLKRSSWLKGEPLRGALRALAKIQLLAGYPRKIKNEAGLDYEFREHRDTGVQFLADWLNASFVEQRLKIYNPSKFNFPSDLVSAFYVPDGNALVIPAALALPPLFYKGGPSAYNYGALGQVGPGRFSFLCVSGYSGPEPKHGDGDNLPLNDLGESPRTDNPVGRFRYLGEGVRPKEVRKGKALRCSWKSGLRMNA